MSQPTTQQPFLWRTHQGGHLRVSDMETSHLMHSLLMIWNNTVPPNLQFQPFRRWRLENCTEYYAEAARCFLIELKTRDLTPVQSNTLAAMGERAAILYGAGRGFLGITI